MVKFEIFGKILKKSLHFLTRDSCSANEYAFFLIIRD